jgi:hypothetical protein
LLIFPIGLRKDGVAEISLQNSLLAGNHNPIGPEGLHQICKHALGFRLSSAEPAGINPTVATRKLWLVTHPLPSVPAEPDKTAVLAPGDDLDRGSAKPGLN